MEHDNAGRNCIGERPLLAELIRSGPGCGVAPLASEGDISGGLKPPTLCQEETLASLTLDFRLVPIADRLAKGFY